MKVFSRMPLGALLGWVGLLLTPAGAAPLDRPPDDAIIARVNGEAVLLSQLKEAAFDQDIPLESLTLEGLRGDGYRRAMTQLVDETLLTQKAAADGIAVDEMRISKHVDEMIQAVRAKLGDQEKLDRFLTEHHLDLGALRLIMTERERRRSLVTDVVVRRVSIDGGAVEKFKQDRKSRGRPLEEVRLAQILIRCPAAERPTAAGKEIYKRALKAAREAGANPKSFADCVRRYSEDAEGRTRGGELGWLDPATLRAGLAQGAAAMEPGDVSPPIESEEGYHILLLLGRHTARDLLFAELFERERVRLVEQLRHEATIHLYDLKGAPLAIESQPTTGARAVAAPSPK